MAEDAPKSGGLEQIFGPQGPLAACLPEYSPRPGQLAMARAVERALRREEPLLVEAGTGIGKTLGYLVPALLCGLKTVVSTGTRTLQDQIAGKELPQLQKALAPSLAWAVLKGRTNYLCLRRYQAFAARPDLGLPGVQGALPRLADWLKQSADGDLDQVPGSALPGSLLAEITASSEQCLGGRCPRRESCFLLEARRRAAEADVVVVNHHLFLADLRLRAQGHGEVLPRYQTVIFDEAHLVPEVATTVFGVTVSRGRLASLLLDLARLPGAMEAAADQSRSLEQAGMAFFEAVSRQTGRGRRAGLTPAMLAKLTEPGQALAHALEALAGALSAAQDEETAGLADRAEVLALDLAAVAQPEPGQSVAWAQDGRAGVSLHLSPVEVGVHLEHALCGELGRLIFTSATMAVGQDLGPFARRLGLPDEVASLVVPSPFDLAANALLYVPRRMPPPASPDFPREVARRVEALLGLSNGRAFVLFTSHRNLRLVSGELSPRLPFPCLVQGQAPRMELLQRFVAESPSVLFATASFWQGVDVPGPALSAVIVDKLPFAPPDDPLVAARCERLEAQGRSSFAHLQVPEAILALKQGLGRLLRSAEDRGLLAVLDARLLSKPYGRRFLGALAPVPLTSALDEVAAFFGRDQDPNPKGDEG